MLVLCRERLYFSLTCIIPTSPDLRSDLAVWLLFHTVSAQVGRTFSEERGTGTQGNNGLAFTLRPFRTHGTAFPKAEKAGGGPKSRLLFLPRGNKGLRLTLC
jgi:hypothetical protein